MDHPPTSTIFQSYRLQSREAATVAVFSRSHRAHSVKGTISRRSALSLVLSLPTHVCLLPPWPT